MRMLLQRTPLWAFRTHITIHLQSHARCLSTLETSSGPARTSSPNLTSMSSDVVYKKRNNAQIVNTELDDVTQLVDRLFKRTRLLMTTTNRVYSNNSNGQQDENKDNQIEQFYHTIAYSGGIDSSLVAAVVYQISLDLNDEVGNTSSNTTSATTVPQHHHVSAILGISPAVSLEQIRQAEDVALHIGIPFVKIPTEEGSNETYIANNGQACFACKSELYTKLIHHTISKYTTQNHMNFMKNINYNHRVDNNMSELQKPLQQQSALENSHVYQKVYNGTNADDCLDPTRVGLIAASQYNVLSPLNTMTKEQVRQVAKHLHLPNWNVASNPCLRSRLAIGIPATKQHLQRIERAERYIRQQLYDIITVETNLRVRLLAQQRGCLEIDAAYVETVTNLYCTHQKEWDQVLLEELQFGSFLIRSFRSGSVAATPASVSTLTNELPSSVFVSTSSISAASE